MCFLLHYDVTGINLGKSMSNRRILTYGTFDLLHIGHLRLLMRARALGDHLTVAISTDEFNLTEKSKTCVIPYADRALLVSNLKCVDEVIPETTWDQKVRDVIDNKIDLFVMGDDWAGHFDFLKEHCDVHYLTRTPNISSSELKQHINTNGKSAQHKRS